MPLCEALSSRRGRGPHHVHKDRVGTWDISCLTTGHVPTWSASGRRGAVADDARTREVELRHSSCEADEQGGAIRCGAGGAFFFQAEDGIRDLYVTGVQTCALPICVYREVAARQVCLDVGQEGN